MKTDLSIYNIHIYYIHTCSMCVCACAWSLSRVWLFLCNPMDCSPPGSSVHGDSPGKNIGVGCHALLQRIFLTHGSNPDLPPCRQILYHLSHQGSQRILAWVAYPISKGTSWPQESNQALLHCRQIIYQLSYQASLCVCVYLYIYFNFQIMSDFDGNPWLWMSLRKRPSLRL